MYILPPIIGWLLNGDEGEFPQVKFVFEVCLIFNTSYLLLNLSSIIVFIIVNASHLSQSGP